MKYKLDLRSSVSGAEAVDSLAWTDVGFIVTGLPPGLEVRIGPKQGGGWQVVEIVDGVIGEWKGDYESPLAALDAVQNSLEDTDN